MTQQCGRIDEGDVVLAVHDLIPAVGHELVDIALVVGEQHEALKVLGRGRRVMLETH
jgi:hypothetical protein